VTLSNVAGIVGKNGGLRVVVTQRWRFRHHVKKGERLFVVPEMLVQEPVSWNEIPTLIERVQKHVARTLAPVNDCGECTACCFHLFIKDERFKKASNTWCDHCSEGFGCKLYHTRPSVCRAFECMWLKSQKRNDVMPAELRPDRCGAIFTDDTHTNDPLIIECHGEPNSAAWQWINDMQRGGYKVKKIDFYFGEKE